MWDEVHIVATSIMDVLTGWVDSDFAADSDTRRSVTGYVMALYNALISWRSCRQGGVTLSSSEAESVAASAVAQENAYLRALLSGLDRSPLGPTCVWEDNAACILMSENPVNCHVDVKFHFLRERVRAALSSQTHVGPRGERSKPDRRARR